MMSPNVYELSSQLKAKDPNGNYVVDNAKLANYLQNPGKIPAPSYLILSEIERRQVEDKQREMYKAMQQGAQPSVKDQAIAANQPAPVVPPHLMAAANPAPMSPEERASSGIAQLAGGGIVGLKDGGIVGYAEGDIVKSKLFGGLGLADSSRSKGQGYPLEYFNAEDEIFVPGRNDLKRKNIGLINLSEEDLAKLSEQDRNLYLQAKDLERRQKNALIAQDIKDNKKGMKEDVEKMEARQKELAEKEGVILPTEELGKDKVLPPPSTESDYASINKKIKELDTSYEDMRLPEDYAQQRVDALKSRLGEDTFSKLAQEEKDYLAKKLTEVEKYNPDLKGEGLLRLGLGVLQSSGEVDAAGRRKGFLAGLGESGMKTADWYEKARDKYVTRKDKLEQDMRAVNRDLAKSQRSEDLAIAKFGEESEQARIANNRTVGLQQKKDALTAIQLEIEGKKASDIGSYYRAGARGLTNAETTRGQKLLDEARKSMGDLYEDLVRGEAEFANLDISDPSKLSKAQIKRYNKYLDLKAMYERKLKEAEKLIGPSLVGNTIGTDRLSNPALYEGFSSKLIKP